MSFVRTLLKRGTGFALAIAFVTMLFVFPVMAQPAKPAKDAVIVSYCIDEAAKKAGYETGPIKITYSDGTQFTESLPPLEKSTPEEIVRNDVGITDPKLADDKQTLGWTVNSENCCTSYSVPLGLVIYKSGKIIRHIDGPPMVWNWMFVDKGKRVAVVWGTVHFAETIDYKLYDVKTGHTISEVYSDEKTLLLRANAPKWAKQLEQNGKNEKPEKATTCAK